MQLQLVQTSVRVMVFRETECSEDENNLEFSTMVNWDSENPSNSFTCGFDLKIQDSSGFDLDLVYEGTFQTDVEVTEDFMSSQWAHVNAPAIVYPFMRAFISNMTINAGKSPVIIPSVNFQQMYKDKQTDETLEKDTTDT
jgi:preprotein translocase subunit SecB